MFALNYEQSIRCSVVWGENKFKSPVDKPNMQIVYGQGEKNKD